MKPVGVGQERGFQNTYVRREQWWELKSRAELNYQVSLLMPPAAPTVTRATAAATNAAAATQLDTFVSNTQIEKQRDSHGSMQILTRTGKDKDGYIEAGMK